MKLPQQDLMSDDSLDALTGLLNRHAFHSKLADVLRGYSKDDGDIALILGDMDHFKAVGDRFGIPPGNEALTRVASLLQSLVRPEDVVCRYGGDEFLILSAGTSAARAKSLAERIETEVARLKVSWDGCDLGPLSMTTGVALCPRDGTRANHLTEAADLTLRRRKRRR